MIKIGFRLFRVVQPSFGQIEIDPFGKLWRGVFSDPLVDCFDDTGRASKWAIFKDAEKMDFGQSPQFTGHLEDLRQDRRVSQFKESIDCEKLRLFHWRAERMEDIFFCLLF